MISFTNFEHETCSWVLRNFSFFSRRCLGQPERSESNPHSEHRFPAPSFKLWRKDVVNQCLEFESNLERRTKADTNSKHWFTTSFLQPLPYLVSP